VPNVKDQPREGLAPEAAKAAEVPVPDVGCSDWLGSFANLIKHNSPSALTEDGKLRWSINQNQTVLITPLDGHPVKLSPDNWKILLGNMRR